VNELSFAKEIIITKYPLSISLLVLNELLGTVLMITGMGAIIPLLSTLMEGQGNIPGSFGAILSYLGLVNAKSTTILTFLIFILFARYVLDVVRGYIAGNITIDISKTFRKDINIRISQMDWLDFIKSDQGKYIQCLTSESQLASGAVNDLASTVAYGVMLGTALIATLMLSIPVTLITGITGIILIIGAKRLITLSHTTANMRIQAAAKLNNYTIDMRNIMKLVKAEGLEDDRQKLTDQLIGDIATVEKKQIVYGLGIDSYNNLFTLLIISLMSYLYLGMGFGNSSALILNLLLVQRTGSYFSNFQQKRRNMAQKIPAYAACKNIIETTPLTETHQSSAQLPLHFQSHILAKNISFAFPNGTQALNDVTIQLPAKGLVGLIGKSGSGKTTLIDILLGLMTPNTGEIYIDDQNMNAISKKEWQNMVTYVPQNSYLIQGTLKDNLLLGVHSNPTDVEIHNALEQANCAKIVARLEQGLDTFIHSGGLNFSGGERQRLCIARGLLRNSRIFVMDEPSASLDKNSELDLKDALHNIANDKLIIIVTHSTGLIEDFETIFIMDDGKCIWNGTHNQLMNQTDMLSLLSAR
jgi:ABC-type multidrug transport system fused ATPase/permease subunit